MSNKEVFEGKYQEFHQELESAVNELDTLDGSDERFCKIRDRFTSLIRDVMSQAQSEATESLESTVWDRLVIAFFGETNAGKSTIVETFRILFNEVHREEERLKTGKGTDGGIVGNGQSDWTKFTTDYEMSIRNQPFTLIDVPGIEGEESKYIGQIRKALNRAHVIFYVQGNNKQPDEGTAGKIKLYLKDWVNVYSINNVKSNTEKYGFDEKTRQTLFTNDTNQLDRLIEASFKRIIPGNYKGNITIQALLALCSVADFSPSNIRMRKKQDNVLNYFGNKEAVFSFSNFAALTDLVYRMASNFQEEIVESNKQKLFSLYQRTCDKVTAQLEGEKNNITDYRQKLIRLRGQIAQGTKDHKSYLSYDVEKRLKQSVSDLKRSFSKCIMMDIPKAEIMDNIIIQEDRIGRELNDDVREIIYKDLEDFNKTIAGAYANCNAKLRNTISLNKLPARVIDVHVEMGNVSINLDFLSGYSVKDLLNDIFDGPEQFILKKIMKAFSVNRAKARYIREAADKIDKAFSDSFPLRNGKGREALSGSDGHNRAM